MPSQLVGDRLIGAKLTGGTVSINGPWGSGSGVLVEDRVLTAAHVVLPPPNTTSSPREVVYDVGTGRQRFPCRLFAFEPSHDIALLEPFDLAATRDLPRFNISSDAHIGDPIWVGGYPFNTEVPVVRRGSIASIVMPIEAMIVDRNMFASENASFPAYWIDVPVFPGNSGGPVLNQHGDLIGLAIETLCYAHRMQQPNPGSEVDAQDESKDVPVYLDIGIALRLDLGLQRTQLTGHLRKG